MTNCLVMGSDSPGVRGLCHKRQEVESTRQWGKCEMHKGLFGRLSPILRLTRLSKKSNFGVFREAGARMDAPHPHRALRASADDLEMAHGEHLHAA
jgi:hypothetical protein